MRRPGRTVWGKGGVAARHDDERRPSIQSSRASTTSCVTPTFCASARLVAPFSCKPRLICGAEHKSAVATSI